MGEVAESMLEGDFCEQCGQYIGEGDGYPRTCTDCGGDAPPYEGDQQS